MKKIIIFILKKTKIYLIITGVSMLFLFLHYFLFDQCELGFFVNNLRQNKCVNNPINSFPCECGFDIGIDLLFIYVAIIFVIFAIIKIIISSYAKFKNML